MKRFIRNENNEIIGTEEVMEENERLNELMNLSKELNLIQKKIFKLQNGTSNIVNEDIIDFLMERQEKILNRINKLYRTRSYRYGELFNFNIIVDEFDAVSYVPESKKELVKARGVGYGIYRNGKKKSDNKPYTLDPKYYK